MPPRVTIRDVAREAGVSVATVSKVINERYGVATETQERVARVVAELGYETSLIASSLRRRRTNVIGVLVAGFEPYSAEVLKGVQAAALETAYELLAYSGPHADQPAEGWERRSLSRLAGTLIDGAIIVTPTVSLTETSVPVVAIDPHLGREVPASIDGDSVQGARAAMEHLLGLGHRRIAHISGRRDLESAGQREREYRRSLTRAGIPYDPDLVRDGGYQRHFGATAARELFALADRPTAIFAANDLSAIGALDAAHELGLRVPEDVSIVGYDDIPEAVASTPPLTTVVQPMGDMGQRAFRMLVDLLSGEDAARHAHLRTRLIVRQSTAPAPS